MVEGKNPGRSAVDRNHTYIYSVSEVRHQFVEWTGVNVTIIEKDNHQCVLVWYVSADDTVGAEDCNYKSIVM